MRSGTLITTDFLANCPQGSTIQALRLLRSFDKLRYPLQLFTQRSRTGPDTTKDLIRTTLDRAFIRRGDPTWRSYFRLSGDGTSLLSETVWAYLGMGVLAGVTKRRILLVATILGSAKWNSGDDRFLPIWAKVPRLMGIHVFPSVHPFVASNVY
jgi:hypothetical protein